MVLTYKKNGQNKDVNKDIKIKFKETNRMT
jgi:hypothetical protein